MQHEKLSQTITNKKMKNLTIIENGGEEVSFIGNPFTNVRRYSTNLMNDEVFIDDQFKMPDTRNNKRVVKKRLKDIYQLNSKISKKLLSSFESEVSWRPIYLSQMKMIPKWHFLSLIEPQTINENGYYEVVICKNGRLIREIIDDVVYYDQLLNRVECHADIEDEPWVHIILKVWAKLNDGYQNIDHLETPFSFIKTFTFPDWDIINPSLEELKNLIPKFHQVKNQTNYYIAKTKQTPNVGYFGLIPNCASYLITGYHQEYADIYLKIKSFVMGSKWNGKFSSEQKIIPSEVPALEPNQFLIPYREFVNCFHLVYLSTNKFKVKQNLFYVKYSINYDARESKARIIEFQVLGEMQKLYEVNVNLYFPYVKGFELINEEDASLPIKQKTNKNKLPLVIPNCKILCGVRLASSNLETSYVESVKEKILQNQEGTFLPIKSHIKYEHVFSDYFQGYMNEVTHNLKIKPGKYYLRLKLEKLHVEYRSILNITSNQQVQVTACKFDRSEQNEFLSETLSHKARLEARNITHIPNRKESWIISNNDFSSIGYGIMLFQVGINSDHTLLLNIDRKKIRQSGYRLKFRKARPDDQYKIVIADADSCIKVFKYDLTWRGEGARKWPPEGITVQRIMNQPKNQIPLKSDD